MAVAAAALLRCRRAPVCGCHMPRLWQVEDPRRIREAFGLYRDQNSQHQNGFIERVARMVLRWQDCVAVENPPLLVDDVQVACIPA